MAKTMSEAILDTKSAIANKLLQDDGTITDITGKEVVSADEGYNSKPALPNKFLNPDGTYSTLNEIIASMVDTSIFVIVDELPATGDPQKIYLVPDGEGGFIEYHWMGDKWDAVGVVEIDLSNYPTLQDMANAIEEAALATLNSAKTYADGKASTAEQNAKSYTDAKIAEIKVMYEWDGQNSNTNPDNLELWSNILKEAKDHTVFVAAPSCIFAVNQTQNEPMTMTYYSMARHLVYPSTPTGYEFMSVDITTSDYNFTVSNVGGMVLYSNQSLPMYTEAVQDYTPTYDYHPATKKYVDDHIGGAGDTKIYYWDGDGNKLVTVLNQVISDDVVSPILYYDGYLSSEYGIHQIGICSLKELSTSDGTHTISFITTNFSKETVHSTGIEVVTYTISASYTCASNVVTTATDISVNQSTGSSSGYYFLSTQDTTGINFTPTQNMHPATKKYVDDQISNNITAVLGGEY